MVTLSYNYLNSPQSFILSNSIYKLQIQNWCKIDISPVFTYVNYQLNLKLKKYKYILKLSNKSGKNEMN